MQCTQGDIHQQMSAVRAALLCVENCIQQLQHSPGRTVSLDKQIVRSVTHMNCFAVQKGFQCDTSNNTVHVQKGSRRRHATGWCEPTLA